MSPSKVFKSPLRIALAALVVVAIAIALSACGSSSGSSSSGGAKPNMTTTTTSGAAASGDAVNIKLIAYKPGTLTVGAGSTVTWHQMDPGVHTVTSGTVAQNGGSVTPEPDGKFTSGEITTGKTYAHRFDTPGTYTYFCEIHPATMHGEITVK
jgi:plastocyanin